MLGLEHLIALLIFIFLGGLGMAAMQEGGSRIWQQIRRHIGSAPGTPRPTPHTRSVEPLVFHR